jgi:hypothetical protein
MTTRRPDIQLIALEWDGTLLDSNRTAPLVPT